MPVRDLQVLDLNDRAFEYSRQIQSGEGIFRHFDVRNLETWRAVQADLASSEPTRPDIVLTDIDFELDPSLQNATFPDCGEAKPIGPLLALPYLGRRAASVFAIYSAHFDRGETAVILKSPIVILPLGLLAATLENKTYHSRHLGGETPPGAVSLEQYLDGIPRVGNPVNALKNILDIYINRLTIGITSGVIRVTNGEQIGRTLDALRVRLEDEESNGQSTQRVSVPGSMSLDTYSRAFGADRIKWLSLCADDVDFVNDDVDDAGLKSMQRFLEVIVGADPAFQKTLEVIRVLEERDEGTTTRPKYLDIASELYSREPEEVRREILRLGVLFANVTAWHKNDYVSQTKQNVHCCLGINDNNTLDGWFGMRTSGHYVARPLKVKPLPLFDSQSGAPNRFLDWHDRRLNALDEDRVAHYVSILEHGGGFCVPD